MAVKLYTRDELFEMVKPSGGRLFGGLNLGNDLVMASLVALNPAGVRARLLASFDPTRRQRLAAILCQAGVDQKATPEAQAEPTPAEPTPAEPTPADRLNDETFEASGQVRFGDVVADFLYVLMRDHLPVGQVQALVAQALETADGEVSFTNGWLAGYARFLSGRMRGAEPLGYVVVFMPPICQNMPAYLTRNGPEVSLTHDLLAAQRFESVAAASKDLVEYANTFCRGFYHSPVVRKLVREDAYTLAPVDDPTARLPGVGNPE